MLKILKADDSKRKTMKYSDDEDEISSQEETLKANVKRQSTKNDKADSGSDSDPLDGDLNVRLS